MFHHKKLRVRMADKGVTIRELAYTMDVSDGTVRSWLTGRRTPNLDRWGILESMFGDDLFEDAIPITHAMPPDMPTATLPEDPEDAMDGPPITETHYGGPPAPEEEPEPEPKIGPAYYKDPADTK